MKKEKNGKDNGTGEKDEDGLIVPQFGTWKILLSILIALCCGFYPISSSTTSPPSASISEALDSTARPSEMATFVALDSEETVKQAEGFLSPTEA